MESPGSVTILSGLAGGSFTKELCFLWPDVFLTFLLPVFFSSLTSLQAEEFFEMVAKAQARRLNDQRADFTAPEGASAENTGVSEDQLYDTILAHQVRCLVDI